MQILSQKRNTAQAKRRRVEEPKALLYKFLEVNLRKSVKELCDHFLQVRSKSLRQNKSYTHLMISKNANQLYGDAIYTQVVVISIHPQKIHD